MIYVLTFIHVIVCLFLIVVVLLQSGKAADLAGAFGGMGSQTAFGPRGAATVLSKATTASAVLFMVTSLSLAILYTRAGGGAGSSVLDKAPAAQTQTAPATKAPATLPSGGQTTPGTNPNEVKIDLSQPAPAAPAGAPAAGQKSAPKQNAPAKK